MIESTAMNSRTVSTRMRADAAFAVLDTTSPTTSNTLPASICESMSLTLSSPMPWSDSAFWTSSMRSLNLSLYWGSIVASRATQ
ncbi:Uncharacterised protein [Mycobacteroides abscessus subsp. abscessus]|nr:Uncharacterised protein [Mycobacteroides abscessus subsp. abscessus]